MNSYWRAAVRAVIFMLVACGASSLLGQDNAGATSLLHIQHSVTTSKTNLPQYLYMYHLEGGADSVLEARSLTGTISLGNQTANFSEVLWVLAYWQGSCPVDDQSLAGANFIWTDILKNPSQSDREFRVDLNFPQPLPMTGCVGFVFGGGPLFEGTVTMSANLTLAYAPSSGEANTVVDLSGEYCFGQNWGCQNATKDDEDGFAVPIAMPAGQLVELYGNISDSTFDGTQNFGPLPTGTMWGALNDFFLLPGGCGEFGKNLNKSGFPKPQPMSTLHSWLPQGAVRLENETLEYNISSGGTGEASLQVPVERIFENPVTVNAGDCIVVIYGRQGNGATDNETQVKALLAP